MLVDVLDHSPMITSFVFIMMLLVGLAGLLSGRF
jgi:hypothetical protein